MRKSAAFAAALLAACTTPPPEQDDLPGDPVALAMDGCTALSLRDFGPGIAIRSASRVPAGGTASGTNATLQAHCRFEGDTLDEAAFKALVREAAEANAAKKRKS